jgi:hypothetical protein
MSSDNIEARDAAHQAPNDVPVEILVCKETQIRI